VTSFKSKDVWAADTYAKEVPAKVKSAFTRCALIPRAGCPRVSWLRSAAVAIQPLTACS
jgi:hypothetical protein